MQKRSIVTILVLIAVLAMALPSVASAQSPEAVPTVIRVTGNGTAYSAPDIAYVSGGVDVTNADVTAAVNDANARIDAVRAALSEFGVEDGDIRTQNFYIYREQFYGPEGPTGDGTFHVTNTLEVTVRNIENVPQVLSAMLAAGANSINGVNYFVADTAAVESEARSLAIDDARAVAEELASLLGVSVGEVVSVTDYSNQNSGQPFYGGGFGGGGGGAAAASVPPVSGGSLAISVNVEVVFELVR